MNIMYAMADKLKAPDKWAWVEWMVAEREKREWSQSDLARKADITRQTVNDYESRRRANPDEQILMRISTALGYPPVYLPRLAGIYPAEPNIDEQIEDLSPNYGNVISKIVYMCYNPGDVR